MNLKKAHQSLILLTLLACWRSTGLADGQSVKQPSVSLLDARRGFSTRIIRDLNDDRSAASQPPTGSPYMLTHFPAPAGALAAYLTRDPGDHRKHPAVVWAHGGFGGISYDEFLNLPEDNDQSPHVFQEMGLAVMIPSWRGTNDNPGKPEFFYGEVDDLVAAVEYMRSRPYVDPSRVYVVGHSTGGTLALLAAEASNNIRCAVAFGPTADITTVAGPRGWPIPFDAADPNEIRLRSAINFVGALKTPTFCVEGSRSPNGSNFSQLQANADASRAPLHCYIIRYGTHFNILHPLTRLLAQKFLQDTGPTCNIQLGTEELAGAFNGFLDGLAKKRTSAPVTITAAAAGRIGVAAARSTQKTYFRVTLTADDKITARTVHEILPTDTVFTSNGIEVALDAETNRALPRVTVDFDPATQRLRISRDKPLR